ncbi:MAG: anti-sigma factor family protein [Thermoleophilaceae bacterium]
MAESHEHITCQDVVELVRGYLDGALPVDEASLFEQHLNFCEGCVWYMDELRLTIATAARLREEDVPPDTREQLLTAFRDWKRA